MRIITEETAKTLWCPFTRVLDRNAGINRGIGTSAPSEIPGTYCVAGRCMAWEPVVDGEHGRCGLTCSS